MSAAKFTASQQDAMDVRLRETDACVVAGPGSGKTTVLVEYFRRLVVEAQIDPTRILAITFTEKAAGNMREKLIAALPDMRAQLERAWVSTVHGFCARLLRENAVLAGIDPEFAVLDERQCQRMQEIAIGETLEAMFAESPGAIRALLRPLASAGVESGILGVYEAARAAGERIEDLDQYAAPENQSLADAAAALAALRASRPVGWKPAQLAALEEMIAAAGRILESGRQGDARRRLQAACGFSADLRKLKRGDPATGVVEDLRGHIGDLQYSLMTELYEGERWTLFDILARFDRHFRARKRQLGALDFTDLEEHAVRLLEEDGAVRARLQAQFDQVLMDEFQDTNPQQERLIELLRPPGRFYAVGDINQSIYGFRHADPEVFRRYRESVRAEGRHLVELADNFRSRPEILCAVETVAGNLDGIEPRPLAAKKSFPELAGPCVEVIAAAGEDAAAAAALEARWVAYRISQLAATRSYRDIAVLVRNTEVLSDFTCAFAEAGIPYLVNRGKGFYENPEVEDLIHLLRAIANPRDEISLTAVLRSPFAEVSGEGLLRLRQRGDNLGAALLMLNPDDGAFDPADREKLARFRDRLVRWRALRDAVSFDRLLQAAIDETGYRPESGLRGAANIEKFLAQARAASPGRSLDAFVEELRLIRLANPREPDAPPEDSANAVEVMTVHSAKGLEYPVVFVAAMQKGTSSDLGAVNFLPGIGVGARWRNPVTGDSKDDSFLHAIREERARREAAEADRLLYVAMTRAEERLVLSFSWADRSKPKNWACVLCEKLALHVEASCDEMVSAATPDGRPWQFRLLSTGAEPPPAVRPQALESESPAQIVERWSPAEQHDTNATVTALTAFAVCPRKYYLGHYLGWQGRVSSPREAAESMDAAEFGTQVHALLAGQPVADLDDAAARLAESFRHSPVGRRAAASPHAEREFDFLMAVEDLVVRGQIDLWFEEPGGIVVVDYKTDRVTAEEAANRAGGYALQLRIYAMALERATGRRVAAAYVHFLRPGTAVEIDLTPSLLDAPEQIVRDFQDAQSNLRFPLNEGEQCRRCPFHKDLCPAA